MKIEKSKIRFGRGRLQDIRGCFPTCTQGESCGQQRIQKCSSVLVHVGLFLAFKVIEIQRIVISQFELLFEKFIKINPCHETIHHRIFFFGYLQVGEKVTFEGPRI